MKIVYTPLHGTGEMLARRALAQAGLTSVQVVEKLKQHQIQTSLLVISNRKVNVLRKRRCKVGADVLPAADLTLTPCRCWSFKTSSLSVAEANRCFIMAKYILEAHKNAGTLQKNALLSANLSFQLTWLLRLRKLRRNAFQRFDWFQIYRWKSQNSKKAYNLPWWDLKRNFGCPINIRTW